MKLAGHDQHVATFRSAVESRRIHHAWLLAGPRGVGKACFAEWAAGLMLDASDPESPGAKLIAAGSHPDFRRLERQTNEKTEVLTRNIKIDQVRALRPMFATATSIAPRRVIIVDAADDLERAAANALLKNLEEPPENTVFLMISHAPGRLLPTIRSRCRSLVFRSLPDDAMRMVLNAMKPSLDSGACDALIRSARGAPGVALALAELDMASLDATLDDIARSGDPTNAMRARLAQALMPKAAAPRYEAFLHRVPAYLAESARRSEGARLATALRAWERAHALASVAVAQSLIPETVVFEMAGLVAALADASVHAKA